MICPKCKTELPDDTIRCPKCGIKLNVICPECKTVNPFGTIFCINCSTELIKICPRCKSYNLPGSKECRKCRAIFEELEYADSQDSDIESDIVKPFGSNINNFNIPVWESFTKFEISDKKSDIEQEQNNEKIFLLEESDEQIYSQIQNANFTPKDNSNEENQIEEDHIKIGEVEDLVVQVNYSLENEESVSEEKKTENFELQNNNQESADEIEIQKEVVDNVINIVKTSITKHVIALNGEEGSGKSAVLKQVKTHLSDNGFICLYGSMTPLLQITSFGFFQDAFLRIMGFPPFVKSSESFYKDFKKSAFSKLFSTLSSSELYSFLNIFYPSKEDEFKNILENKKQIFSVLEKVLTSLLMNNNIAVAIDNFELLDGASYDFIVYLMEKGYFNNRLKLIAAYQENKAIESYFDSAKINEDIFETIIIKKFNHENILQAAKRTFGISMENILEKEYLETLIKKSNGNAIRLEQEIAFLFDTKYIDSEEDKIVIKEENKPEISPETFEELIKLRLNSLTPAIKNILFTAASMGYRFSTTILFSALEFSNEKIRPTLDFLSKELYIDFVDNYTCEFKSLTLWKIIFKEAKEDSLYKDNSQRLYTILKPLILSSNLQKLISCKEALNTNEEFTIWQNTAKLCAKLGDTNLYVISQKQCLKLLDDLNLGNEEEIRAVIYEEIGKLLCEKSPKESLTYIANILDAYIKNSDIRKIIDLSGYFIKSCYLTGNYFGVSEAADAVISSLSGSNSAEFSNLDISLIKTRKLPALLNIGNSEQIINLVNEEILPDIEKELNKEKISSFYSSFLIHARLLCNVTLAKAYAIQGNKYVFNVIVQLRELIAKYNYNSEYYITQTDILEAFANTITGQIEKSFEILNNIAAEYNDKKMDTALLAEWNLVHAINRVLCGQTEDLKADLFELAAFTNNINEHSMKNIVKLILGYILKEEGSKTKALEIFNEEITYFAKEKIAIGAMLSWALIVQITMSLGDFEKALNTASKSLEIAQSPKINNYFFTICFQKYLAEIYIIKEDLTAAKMYLEKAIMIAKQFDLKYQLVELYIAYGKYLEELMQSKNTYSEEYVKLTSDMYNKAISLAKSLHLNNLTEKAVRERASFKVFCQLNSITQ